MPLEEIVERLSRTDAYPHPVDTVSVKETHISVVFLAGEYAYKLKKPVRLGFLDYSSLEKRHYFCEEEIRLNRRLAPEVYLEVTPITREKDRIELAGSGEVIDYVVKMRRLPDDKTLLELVRHHQVGAFVLERLARRLAEFHRKAESGDHVSVWSRSETVLLNAEENFHEIEPFVGTVLSPTVYERLHAQMRTEFDRIARLMDDRASRRLTRDTHGDLHLDHVYFFDENRPPGDFLIVDAIEFNKRFRYADPVKDIAFLAMDLDYEGHPDLSRHFADAYLAISVDPEGHELLPFYKAYLSIVRGKVECLHSRGARFPVAGDAATDAARAHFLLALGLLSPPRERPCLVLIGGLPGSGKTTLATRMEETLGFSCVSSDRVRKELAGVDPEADLSADYGESIYDEQWNERTYATCLERARAGLFEGKRMVVDATFTSADQRDAFFDLARRWRLPCLFFLCETEPRIAEARLAARGTGPSDADARVYREMSARADPIETQTREYLRRMPAKAGAREVFDAAFRELSHSDLI